MNPAFVFTAIQTGLRLGQSVHDALIDHTSNRPLLLPVGDLFGDITLGEANQFFLQPENIDLIRKGGPYHGLQGEMLIKAYRTVCALEPDATTDHDRQAVVSELIAFEQVKETWGPSHPARRIVGIAIEVGLKFFAHHPAMIDRSSVPSRILGGFVNGIDPIDWTPETRVEVLGPFLQSALVALQSEHALSTLPDQLDGLLGGTAHALVDLVSQSDSVTERVRREQQLGPFTPALLRGGAEFFAEITATPPSDLRTTKRLVQQTESELLAGIANHAERFTPATIATLFTSALRLGTESFGETDALRLKLFDLITSTLEVLDRHRKSLPNSLTPAILLEVLEQTRNAIDSIPRDSRQTGHPLPRILDAVLTAWSPPLAGPGRPHTLLSTHQQLGCIRILLQTTCRNHERLVPPNAEETRRTPLAQLIASVAHALGRQPRRLVDAQGYSDLLEIAVGSVLANPDRLLDCSQPGMSSNLLFQSLRQVFQAIAKHDTRGLVQPSNLPELLEVVFPVISANTEALHRRKVQRIGEAVANVLKLASGSLAGRIDATVLPLACHQLLHRVLWDELNLRHTSRVEQTVKEFLQQNP